MPLDIMINLYFDFSLVKNPNERANLKFLMVSKSSFDLVSRMLLKESVSVPCFARFLAYTFARWMKYGFMNIY